VSKVIKNRDPQSPQDQQSKQEMVYSGREKKFTPENQEKRSSLELLLAVGFWLLAFGFWELQVIFNSEAFDSFRNGGVWVKGLFTGVVVSCGGVFFVDFEDCNEVESGYGDVQ